SDRYDIDRLLLGIDLYNFHYLVLSLCIKYISESLEHFTDSLDSFIFKLLYSNLPSTDTYFCERINVSRNRFRGHKIINRLTHGSKLPCSRRSNDRIYEEIGVFHNFVWNFIFVNKAKRINFG